MTDGHFETEVAVFHAPGDLIVCASCADGVHGDCQLWGLGGTCQCPCVKRCTHRPDKHSSASCDLPLGHPGYHQATRVWVRDEDRTPWARCLCGYQGSPPHQCDLTEMPLTITVTDSRGRTIEIATSGEDAIDIEAIHYVVMDGLRQLADRNWSRKAPDHPFTPKARVSWECEICNGYRGSHVKRSA